MFSTLSGAIGCPPQVRIVERGKSGKKNVMFCHLSVDQDSGQINWRIGELSAGKTFESISWKTYEKTPGVKNKGIGSQDTLYDQGIFEGSKMWVEFMEKKKYKLLFPEDEVVGNQIYFMRSTEPEMLTSNFTIPDAMLAADFDIGRLPPSSVIMQPKYDGKRNLCGFQEGKVVSASRGKKQAKSRHAHIHDQAMILFAVIQEKIGYYKTEADGKMTLNQTCPYWLDGELFRFGMNFQQLMSATQSSVNFNQKSTEIDYIIYDLIDDGSNTQLQRLQFLQMIFSDPRVQALQNIKLSPSFIVEDHNLLVSYHKELEKFGYEGAIVRDPMAKYVQKRTQAMMKMKTWTREEWFIVGAEVATGFHEGCIVYILNSKPDGTGLICKGTPIGGDIGTLESRRAQWNSRHLFITNPPVVATLEFFEKSMDGVPRFPGIIAFNRQDY